MQYYIVFNRRERVTDFLTGKFLYITSRKAHKTIESDSLLIASRKLWKFERKAGHLPPHLKAVYVRQDKSKQWHCAVFHTGAPF